MKSVLVCLVLALSLGVAGLWAQQNNAGSASAPSASVPRLVKFTGVLTDLTGKPLNGPVEVTFSLYQNESDAEPLWQETQTVEADAAGHYTVLLGAMSAQGLPMELFTSGEARWLGVAAGTLPEQPRVLWVSVPYALEAGDAATLGGKPASAYLLAQPSGGSASGEPQTGGATTAGAAGSQSGARSVAAVATPLTVGGTSAGTQNYVAKWVDSSNDLGNSLLFDNGTNVGINTTTPGTLNGTYFPAVMFQASQATASSYLTADTELANGYAGLLLNRGGANADNRLWCIDNQPASGNTSSRLAFSTYTDAGNPTPVLTMLRTGNVGIGTSTPGTLNGTYFPSLLLQAAQATASTYLTADTELPGGYAGLLLNRGAATANNRIWVMENQPSASNTSSQFAISTYTDAGMPTALLTILRSGNVGIGTTTPAFPLDVAGNINSSGTVTAAGFSGAGPSLTNLTPGNISAGTAGINISGIAATATNALSLGGVGAGSYARLDIANSFTGNQSVTGDVSATGSVSGGTGSFSTSVSSVLFNSPTAGASLAVKAQDGTGSGGALSIAAGNAGATNGGAGGNLTLQAGYAVPQGGMGYTNQGPGGSVTIAAGGGYNGYGGSVLIEAGPNSNWSLTPNGFSTVSLVGTNLLSNDGAEIDVESAHNGSSTNAPLSYGGNVRITAGNGNGGLSGGSIILNPGTGSPNGNVTVNGNLNVTGSLSKGSGSFKIDHPLDPANKYLYHSFVESPDMMNIYNGNVVTDDKGEAEVVLPDYFEALNRDFRYQLTVIGQFAQAIVGTKIKNHRFTIRTDKPSVEVSWQVTGIRQDAYANAHRIQVEEDKPVAERGYYLHPELFGAPKEKGIEALQSAPQGSLSAASREAGKAVGQ